MKRLLFLSLVLAVSVQAFSQFGAFDKFKKVKKTAETVKKVGEALRPINEKEEYYIGRAVTAQILDKYQLLKNETLTGYISLVGNFLAIRSERPQIFDGYRFAVLNSDEINAFAAPGGFILLTKGLIKACDNEDELAAVIAHEVSHIVVKDPVKSIKSNRLKSLFQLAADELDTGGPKAVGLLKDSVGDIAGTLLVNGYSRGQEKDADLAALDLLSQCGYAPASLLSMLQKLQEHEVKKSKVYSAHPKAKDRCQYVEKALGKQDAGAVNEVRSARYRAVLKLAGL